LENVVKRILLAVFVTAAFALPASAGTLVIFNECAGLSGCSSMTQPWLKIDLDARHDGTGVAGGDARIEVINPIIYGPNALGFNISGSHSGLTIFDLSPGYSVGGMNEPIGPFGNFDFSIDGPPAQTFGTARAIFWIGRDGGFLDSAAVFTLNQAGYLAGANAFDYFDASRTFTSAAAGIADIAPIPEPGTMMLLATGLVAAWRGRRSVR
jgi:hypothetical protein